MMRDREVSDFVAKMYRNASREFKIAKTKELREASAASRRAFTIANLDRDLAQAKALVARLEAQIAERDAQAA